MNSELKFSAKFLFTFIISLFFLANHSTAQNWGVLHGNNERNGISKLSGPQSVNSPLWTVNNATHTNIACNIYTFGDYFVNSRRSSQKAIIECRNLQTGALLWTSPHISDTSMLYVTAFNEDAVYAHDYHTGNYYAFNRINGSIKWVYDGGSYTFGPYDSPIFTCEGNLVINSSLDDFHSSAELLICLDKETGNVLWNNINWVPYLPNKVKAAHANKLYMITGAAVGMPKKLVAVDLTNGNNLYYSYNLPGSDGQNYSPFIGPDGTIYFFRDPVLGTGDGGTLFSFTDTGSDFLLNWTYLANYTSSSSSSAIDLNGNILIHDNGRIKRIDKQSGLPTDSTTFIGTLTYATILTGADSAIYVSNKSGQNFAFSFDLQTLIWSKTTSSNTYSAPVLAKDGTMIFAGTGTSIEAYKFSGSRAPVADFFASSRVINAGDAVNLFDISSFAPTSWQWEFQGANIASSSDQNPQNVTFSNPGIYEIKLIASNSFGSDTLSKSCYILVKESTHITHNPNNELILYPNPASEFFNISGVEYGENHTVVVLDIAGKTVVSQKYYENNNICIKNLNNGLYFVLLYNGNDIIFKNKLIIHK